MHVLPGFIGRQHMLFKQQLEHKGAIIKHLRICILVTGLLTGCAGAGPHNSVEPAQSEKSRTILKNLLKMLIKSGIPIDFQDF